MDREALDKYNEVILAEAASRFGVAAGECRLIADSESFVYDCLQNGNRAILRVTPESHRALRAMRGELEWIGYLTCNGVGAAAPIASLNGVTIETVARDGVRFLVVLFERAPGRAVERSDWKPAFFEEWGRVLGRMHRLQATFVPSRPEHRRPNWDEEYTITAAKRVLANDPEILEKQAELVEQVRALPSDSGSFGLIHSDLEDENFFISGSKITAFDFEECHHHWFAYDIACVLREGTWMMPGVEIDRDASLRTFGEDILRGYRREKSIDGFWLKQLPLFTRLRDACCYVYFLGKREWSSLSEGEKRGVQAMRERLRGEIPCFDIDLTK